MLAEQVLSGAFSFNCLQLLRGESPCKFILAIVNDIFHSHQIRSVFHLAFYKILLNCCVHCERCLRCFTLYDICLLFFKAMKKHYTERIFKKKQIASGSLVCGEVKQSTVGR
ncbi:hypothetical protein T05_6076 [Trichinella murrelli]|uniref:Uncharacterized protein n=1 Tax=Trichinella murrelli TaxID=144512 RepID=A0A0V0U767_9BILA|nr:hypothetical protein T05_6076 [Trichinella murrelli]